MKMKKIVVFLLFCCVLFAKKPIHIFSQNQAGLPEAASTDDVLAYLEEKSFSALITGMGEFPLSVDQAQITRFLWEKYLETLRNDFSRKLEHDNRALVLGKYTMRFSLDKIGNPSANGYPLYIALHGGGQGSSAVNDSQWQQMQIYYKDSVADGIYVAPRGITDTWNLHFVDESYSLYDRLIENLIAFEGADPDRVYLLGFSAGGDGVYQITPKMADRWAAASMSAGHPNGISPINLYNVPFLLQVGEYDSAYDRNIESVNYWEKLSGLHDQYQSGYINALFLHYHGSHNNWYDNDPSGRLYPVLADPVAWRDFNQQRTVSVNTNAVQWLNRYTRNPLPGKVIRNFSTNAPRPVSRGAVYAGEAAELLSPQESLFYWFDTGPEKVSSGILEGEYVFDEISQKNRIYINSVPQCNQIRILLHRDMIPFDKRIGVTILGDDMPVVTVRPDLAVMARTLLERGDKHYCFQAEIVLQSGADGTWSLSSPSTSVKGDADGDGKISIIDALYLARYCVGLEAGESNEFLMDTDCNSRVNIIDALIIAQYCVGLVTDFCLE